MSEVKVPNDRARTAAEALQRGARAAAVRRNAWLLGGVAVFFYVGYMAWMFIRSTSGG